MILHPKYFCGKCDKEYKLPVAHDFNCECGEPYAYKCTYFVDVRISPWWKFWGFKSVQVKIPKDVRDQFKSWLDFRGWRKEQRLLINSLTKEDN